MKSRPFLISILCLFGSFAAFACGDGEYLVEPDLHWIFYTGYNSADENWQSNLNRAFREENITFWHNYVHQKVSKEEVEAALYDVMLLNSHTQNAFFRYLIDHNDKEALQYWMLLKTSDSAYIKKMQWQQSVWFYDEKEGERYRSWWNEDEQPLHDLSISQVETLDESVIDNCKNAQIRHRYLLQVMRKYFYSRDYHRCIKVWEKYGKTVPKSVLRSQCLNYYGGALRRVDRDAEAAIAYATIGYFNPKLHYDVKVLQDIYLQDPNSEAFEFMIQEFVNTYFDHSYRKRHDKPYYDYYSIQEYILPETAKSLAFNKLSDKILKEGKTNNPGLWLSAQSALAFIDGDLNRALSLLGQAEKQKGSKAVKENIRMMKLMFNALRTDIDDKYEETLYPDLKWLVNIINAEDTGECFCYNDYNSFCQPSATNHHVKVLRRTILLGVIPHFQRLNMPYKYMAYQNLYDEVVSLYKKERSMARKGEFHRGPSRWGSTYIHPPIYRKAEFDSYLEPHEMGEPCTKIVADSTLWFLNVDYRTDFFTCIDTANMRDLLRYVQFLKSGGKTAMEKFVIQNNYRDLNFYNELIATKYMRMEKYDSALVYLKRVSPKFLRTQNISMEIDSEHNPFTEGWITRKEQQAKFQLPFNPAKAYADNPSKETFCKVMLKLKNLMQNAKSEEERANAAYAYGLGLFRSNIGHAWALNYYEYGYNWGSHYGHGAPGADEELEAQVNARVDEVLDIALKETQDNILSLKCKILHSQQRKPYLVKIKENDYWEYEIFNKSVRETFCDLACDYDRSKESQEWRWSAWYY
jgi:hypothetical protein